MRAAAVSPTLSIDLLVRPPPSPEVFGEPRTGCSSDGDVNQLISRSSAEPCSCRALRSRGRSPARESTGAPDPCLRGPRMRASSWRLGRRLHPWPVDHGFPRDPGGLVVPATGSLAGAPVIHTPWSADRFSDCEPDRIDSADRYRRTVRPNDGNGVQRDGQQAVGTPDDADGSAADTMGPRTGRDHGARRKRTFGRVGRPTTGRKVRSPGSNSSPSTR